MDKGIETIDCKGKGFNGLYGAVIHDRFKIIKAINQGSFGYIYQVLDLKKNADIVLKVQEE